MYGPIDVVYDEALAYVRDYGIMVRSNDEGGTNPPTVTFMKRIGNQQVQTQGMGFSYREAFVRAYLHWRHYFAGEPSVNFHMWTGEALVNVTEGDVTIPAEAAALALHFLGDVKERDVRAWSLERTKDSLRLALKQHAEK